MLYIKERWRLNENVKMLGKVPWSIPTWTGRISGSTTIFQNLSSSFRQVDLSFESDTKDGHPVTFMLLNQRNLVGIFWEKFIASCRGVGLLTWKVRLQKMLKVRLTLKNLVSGTKVYFHSVPTSASKERLHKTSRQTGTRHTAAFC